MPDIITTTAYVNNKGRIKSEFCNKMAKEPWGLGCITKYLDISCTHYWNTKY